MLNNMMDILKHILYGVSGNTEYDSNCALQQAARKQIFLTELDSEVKALIEHYHISESDRGKSATTTLSEISTVVYRERHRADAYSHVLRELYDRTGFKLEIINSKNHEKKDN